MKIVLLLVGKTETDFIAQGLDLYLSRIKHYTSFQVELIPALKQTKSLSFETQKQQEGVLILNKIQPSDQVILLDEKGQTFRSVTFAQYLQKKMLSGIQRLVFVIGGPYGFSSEMYQRANETISLSPMTFSHQLVRLIFAEQLYRALTILKNEPYHHE